MKFARLFRGLQVSFPGTSAEQAYPTELTDFVQAVTFVPAPAANAPGFFPFAIAGPAGAGGGASAIADTSVVSDNLWTPYLALSLSHLDVVARECQFLLGGTLASGATGFVSLRSSLDAGAGASWPPVSRFPLHRTIWVPPRGFLRAEVLLATAGTIVTIAGFTAALGLAEPSPPLF